MTLQEKAFMCDLIRKTYRRRMFVFWLFVIAVSAPLVLLILLPYHSAFSVEGTAFISLISIVVAINYYNQGKYLSAMPWTLKKMQAEALEAYSQGNFEELSCSAPLKEYFIV